MFDSRRLKAILAVIYVLLLVPFVVILTYMCPSCSRPVRRFCGQLFLFLFRIKVKVEGQLRDDVNMILLNHQSFLDVIYFEAIHRKNLCWVAKKELGDYFFYGHALKAPKMILLDREDKRSLVMLFRLAKERLDEGRVLAIFPEGTRSKGGEKLLPFKPGAKMLIEKYQLTYQPIVAVNTRNVFDMGKLLIGGGEALFVAMEPETYTKEESKVDQGDPSQESEQNHEEENGQKKQDWYDDLRERMQQCYLEHYRRFNEGA